jgi:DNA-directed RNA polymerase subunit RPC12/RpoP
MNDTGTEWTWRCLRCKAECIEYGGGIADPPRRRVACPNCGRVTRQERVL